MVKHKDTIIKVTFTARGRRYEGLSLQSADYMFAKTVNPYGYKFTGVEAVRAWLLEERTKIFPDSEKWSYLKSWIHGTRYPDGKFDHYILIWLGRRVQDRVDYEDIKIEKAVAFDKATDTETDITPEFLETWTAVEVTNPIMHDVVVDNIRWVPIDPKALPLGTVLDEADLGVDLTGKEAPSDRIDILRAAVGKLLTERFGKKFGLKAVDFSFDLSSKD